MCNMCNWFDVGLFTRPRPAPGEGRAVRGREELNDTMCGVHSQQLTFQLNYAGCQPLENKFPKGLMAQKHVELTWSERGHKLGNYCVTSVAVNYYRSCYEAISWNTSNQGKCIHWKQKLISVFYFPKIHTKLLGIWKNFDGLRHFVTYIFF